ncbi:MAG: peptide ABC transporter permease [Rhodospirillales bacterium CG15_BIG_FIL_POST_REV_8_21_14_020_66_15]|nr:MAG: peptide ABC transporter permease [Rhodospirillales bacterium CG15_BIG_FIL_POST_REV_8_21_14_020_66_15]
MGKYILKRVLLMIPTLLGAAILVFLLLRMAPGDICAVRFLGTGMAVAEDQIAMCREQMGLDKPQIVQFFDFIWGYVIFDLGESMWTGQPVAHEIAIRFELSLQVAIMATLVATVIAIPLGIISAVRQNTLTDYVVRGFAIAGIAIPSFWLGLMIILGLLVFTQAWFGDPWMPPINFKSIWDDPAHNLAQLIWPAVATGYRYSAVATRMTRSAMLEVLREDYVRTARAKGMLERIVINRHALKNALLPVVTILALEFAFLMGGLVVTEQVFNLNGLGNLMVDGVERQDFTLTQNLVMLVVIVYVFVNLMTDLAYAWLDPRIRYS